MKTLLQWQIASSKVQSRSSDVDDEVPTMCRFLPPPPQEPKQVTTGEGMLILKFYDEEDERKKGELQAQRR